VCEEKKAVKELLSSESEREEKNTFFGYFLLAFLCENGKGSALLHELGRLELM
jgi:hypothetical protein